MPTPLDRRKTDDETLELLFNISNGFDQIIFQKAKITILYLLKNQKIFAKKRFSH